jgi:hypothetical protein
MRDLFNLENVTLRPFVRNIDGNKFLEIFLVTAVTTVLLIRFFLSLTGYPQLSGGGLHIAHVLVGGFAMMASIVILLAFLDKHSVHLAAVLGGFGFGAFIDELGKFITADTNYFFQPTVALIYIIFIFLYISFQTIDGRRGLSSQEKVINVLEITKAAVINDLDVQERRRALELLGKCDPEDPLVKALDEMLLAFESATVSAPGFYSRMKEWVRSRYLKLVQKRWFSKAVVAVFILDSLVSLLDAIIPVFGKILDSIFKMHLVSLTTTEWLGIAMPALASVFVVAGIFRIRSDRLAAYQRFNSAILIQIFLVQVIAFYRDQFVALIGLGGNILILAVLQYMINQEEAMMREPHASAYQH